MMKAAPGGVRRAGIVTLGVVCAVAMTAAATSAAGAVTTQQETGVPHRAAAKPSAVGVWSKAVQPPTDVIGISAVLLHTGKVMLFGGPETEGEPVMSTTAYIYNPATGAGHEVATPVPVFCGALVQLSDGRLLSVGGASEIPKGTTDVWLFDPATEKWTQQPDTPLGRYYPTVTRLPSGQVLITAGMESDGVTQNPTAEIYTPPPAGGTVGTLKVVGGAHSTPWFPHQWVMPDGNVLQVRNKASYRFNPTTSSWKSMGTLPATTGTGAAGMMLPGGPAGSDKVMSVGGMLHAKALATTEEFDYAHPARGWSLGPRLPRPRGHTNLVQVPDGSAFAIGGNQTAKYDDPMYRTLRFDPSTGKWAGMAVQSVRRTYHSTAVLLPDGRIMSAGDTGPEGGGSLLDFYSPPYLFTNSRPRISSAPAKVKYGSTFRVATSGSTATQAVLMAPSATTHADEMNARRVTLAIHRSGNRLTATTPKATVAPPGYYMLFVLNHAGTPSRAHWLHIGP